MIEYLDVALLSIRVIIGSFFLVHGFRKLLGISEFIKWLGSHGYRPPILWASLILIAEFLGGIGLLLGMLTKLFAIMMSIVMLQGIYHRKKIKSLSFVDGWEINYVSLSGLFPLILLGSGSISLDRILGIQLILWNFFF